MALDSIAKLSVLITGDESPLAASANRAEQIVADVSRRIEDPWARGLAAMKAQNDKWAAGLANLAAQNAPGAGGPFDHLSLGARQYSQAVEQAHQRTVQLSTVMAAMRGNIPAIFKMAGAAAPPILGMLALGKATYELAAAGDALKDSMGEVDTWAAQWDRLKVSVSNTAGTVGGPLAVAFKDASSDMATWIDQFNNWAFPGRMKQLQEHIAAVARQEQEAAQAARDAAAAKDAQVAAAKRAREIAEQDERERDAMSDFQRGQFSRADAIRDMVRTPGEELNRFAIELRSLFTAGFIDQETMNRALEMAEEKARNAVEGKQGAAAKAQGPVAAVERFTSAGFTAVQQAQNNLRVQEEHKRVAQQGVQLQQQEVNLSQQILQTLSQFPTTAPFALSRLN